MKKYSRWKNSIVLKSYTQYQSMLARCSERTHKLRPDYSGNSLHPDWLSFDNYMDWATKQIGFLSEESNGRNWSLDKDILKKGNKHYCPELCVFVPNSLNLFFKQRENKNSDLPLGVSLRSDGGYRARVNNGSKGNISLGTFQSIEEAHEAYLIGKTNLGKELADKYVGLVDERVLEVVSDFRKWFLS